MLQLPASLPFGVGILNYRIRYFSSSSAKALEPETDALEKGTLLTLIFSERRHLTCRKHHFGIDEGAFR